MIPVLITLLTALLCRTTENPLALYLQPDASLDCPVPDLRNDCIENCEIGMIECFIGCNNNCACLRECLRGGTDCIQYCPCELFCPQGCTGCDNPICQEVTTSSQADTTTSPTANAVLILNTRNSGNVPMIVDFDGNINENLSFEYGDGTRADRGCGVTLNGEFWYFGGDGIYKNTVSKIVGCQLVKQSDMAFDLTFPACNTFLEPTPKVLLCFHEYDDKLCHSFDGENYKPIESSKYSHTYTLGLANYKGKALTTGCIWQNRACSFATELFDMNKMKWSDDPAFPFGSICIFGYSTANSPDAAYIIGGSHYSDMHNFVAEFRDDQWSQLNHLNKGRYLHGSINIGTRTMIVGGYPQGSSLETEVWELENGNNKVITPALNRYYGGIGLYAVDFNFCSN